MAEYVRIADPKKPGDYLVIAKPEYDPSQHTLLGDVPPVAPIAVAPASAAIPVARVEYAAIKDPDKPGDYLLIAKADFDPAKHERYDKPVPVYEPPVAALQASTPAGPLIDPATGLRTDGPTFEEFTAAGYTPDAYPPAGYVEKPSAGLSAFRAAQRKAAVAAFGDMTAQDAIAAIKEHADAGVLAEARLVETERKDGARKTVLAAFDARLDELRTSNG